MSQARFLVIDTETTGTNPLEDTIVEVSTMWVVGHEITPAFSSLVNPQCPICKCQHKHVHFRLFKYVQN